MSKIARYATRLWNQWKRIEKEFPWLWTIRQSWCAGNDRISISRYERMPVGSPSNFVTILEIPTTVLGHIYIHTITGVHEEVIEITRLETHGGTWAKRVLKIAAGRAVKHILWIRPDPGSPRNIIEILKPPKREQDFQLTLERIVSNE